MLEDETTYVIRHKFGRLSSRPLIITSVDPILPILVEPAFLLLIPSLLPTLHAADDIASTWASAPSRGPCGLLPLHASPGPCECLLPRYALPGGLSIACFLNFGLFLLMAVPGKGLVLPFFNSCGRGGSMLETPHLGGRVRERGAGGACLSTGPASVCHCVCDKPSAGWLP